MSRASTAPGPSAGSSGSRANELRIRKSPAYRWGPPIYDNRGPAHIDEVIWKIAPEDNTRLAAVMTGQSQITQYVPYSGLATLRTNRNIQLVESKEAFWTYFIGFKIDKEGVNDPAVRRAMVMAVDQAAIAKNLFFRRGRAGLQLHQPERPRLEQEARPGPDPDQRRRGATASSTRPAGRAAPTASARRTARSSRRLAYGFTGSTWQKLMEAVQGDLRKIGVDLKVQLFDPTAAWGKMATQEFDLFGMSYPYISAGDALNLYFRSANIPTPNRMNYKDAWTDQLLDKGMTALSDEDRAAAYGEVLEQVHKAAVWIPLYHEPMKIAMSARTRADQGAQHLRLRPLQGPRHQIPALGSQPISRAAAGRRVPFATSRASRCRSPSSGTPPGPSPSTARNTSTGATATSPSTAIGSSTSDLALPGRPTRTIDGRGLMVMPGLVNIHSHPASEPLNKGWNDEIGSAKLYNSSLYEFMPLFRPDAEGAKAAVTVACASSLLSGVTTLVDLSVAHGRAGSTSWARAACAGSLAPMYRSARWSRRTATWSTTDWDEDAGRKAMEEALRLCDEAARHPCGRLSGMVAPAQIDTCSADLIRDSFAAAQERGLPFQIHAAQSVVEFHEITRRHGVTPIEWLDSLGVLSERSIIGHGIFLDHHPGAGTWPKRDDLATLAATRTTVAHCPTVFLRRGIAMKTPRALHRPRRADRHRHRHLSAQHARGDARGADHLPADERERVRTCAPPTSSTPRRLGRRGAGPHRRRPPRRRRQGRHRPRRPAPFRRCGRCAIPSAASSTPQPSGRCRTVFVNGEAVVEDGRVTTMDYDGAAAALEEAQRRVEGGVASLDWAKRDHAEISPYTFPVA